MPIGGGHAFELAGWEPSPSEHDAWIAALLGTPPTGELLAYADPRRGAFRYAGIVEGRLEACLMLARRSAELPARDALADALGSEISAAARLALLAGRVAGPVDDPGRTICACFAVGLRTLRRAIVERRLASVAEIGRALRAGTNCGSCIPELAGILRRVEVESAPLP
jgi:assimilatory nitrate reductase catalytic subunit